MKKYKLIKSFPGSPEVGSILHYLSEENNNYDGNGAMYYDMWSNRWEAGHVESNPEYFAPYLFTTEDGVEIYTGDLYWAVRFSGTVPIVQHSVIASLDSLTLFYRYRKFSSEEVMQKYLDDLNKPKFQKGEWLYYDSGLSKTLFRFDAIISNGYYTTNEGYQIMDTGSVYCFDDNTVMWSTSVNVSKATPKQIEKILTAVAKHKGFKEGVEFKSASAWSGDLQTVLSETFKLSNKNLYVDSEQEAFVYYNGKWAEIVKEEDIEPEFVECIRRFSPEWEVGKIYTWPYPNNEKCCFNFKNWKDVFKPSTKEAYDAQNTKATKTKNPIMITLSSNPIVESDEKTAIVDLDSDGNVVRIEVLI